MVKLNVLTLSGSPYEMGYQHGEKYADAIRMFAEDRVNLCSDPHWTGVQLQRGDILELAAACVTAHEAYAPALMEELQGMSDATGVGLPELIIMNGFTDFIDLVYAAGRDKGPTLPLDDCTAFLVPNALSAGGQGYLAQTWDMHATATPYVLLMDGRPQQGPRFLSFTVTGCIGMIGMNEAGICVGINNLMGADGQVGVTWVFVVRQMLAQDNLDAALDCLLKAPLVGAHNYLLFDASGRGYNVEAMASRYHVETLQDVPLVHTNHCIIPQNIAVQRQRPPASQAQSELRLSQGQHLLRGGQATPQRIMEVLRDEEAICVRAAPPLHVESCGAAIMRPATGDFWAVWGLPSENEFEQFRL